MFSLTNRLLLGVALLAALAAAAWLVRRLGRRAAGLPLTLGAAAAVALLAFYAYAVVRQLAFPLQIECMELSVLQHAARFAAGLPVYPPPSADFVPLAYNPGLYVVLAPFVKAVGPGTTLLRAPAVAATVALIALFAAAGRRATGSWRWAVVAAALPALATRSLDCYLTKGHGDSLMILCALAGALLLGGATADRARPGDGRRARLLLAAALLAASFWFKQHGALPALGAGVWLLWRERARAWPPLLLLALLGPAAYVLAGPALFGPDFHLSTFTVPSSWSHWGLQGPLRFVSFVASWWAAPALAAAWAWLDALRRGRLADDPVLFLWPFALLSGLMGSLDIGSSDNVFAMAGVWTLFVAVRNLWPRLAQPDTGWSGRAAFAALAFTVALLANDPRKWVPSARAREAHRDLVAMLEGLGGPVYAPWYGDLPAGVPASARAHWVALEDRVRGHGRPVGARDFVRATLAPVADAPAPAFILTINRLENDRILSWLAADYELQEELGARFDGLRELPTRFGYRQPRYLYRKIDRAVLAGDAAGAPATAMPATEPAENAR